MPYLTKVAEIRAAIAHYSRARTLWLDVEVADYRTKNPRLSLLQILDNSTDLSGKTVAILDLLEQPELTNEFIDQIMVNPEIEKVFHNAKYDRQFLGKRKGKNLTCTLEMVKQIPYYLVPLPNYKLKTLAEILCHFPPIDKTEQTSDWGLRPLRQYQIEYARMDPVYTAQVHHRLLQLSQLIEPKPERENIAELTHRYQQIYNQWRELDTEIEHLKTRIKNTMKNQNIHDIHGCKLTSIQRKNYSVSLNNLAEAVHQSGQEFELSIKLTQTMQKALSDIMKNLSVQEDIETILQLKIKDIDEDELPF